MTSNTSTLVTDISTFISRVNSCSNPEVEFRFTETGLKHGISYSTFKRIMLLRVTHSDESHIESDSLVYTNRGTRYIFTENSERMVAEVQTKNQLVHLFSSGAPIPYKLALSAELPYPSVAIRAVDTEKITSDLISAYTHVFNVIHTANTEKNILIFGRDEYITDFIKSRSSLQTNKITFIDGILEDISKLEDMVRAADVVLDNNFILNFCNRDRSSLSNIYTTINRCMRTDCKFIGIRYSDTVNSMDNTQKMYPGRKYMFSRAQLNRVQYKLYMYKYNIALVDSYSCDSVEVNTFVNATRDTLAQYISSANRLFYVRRKHTHTFIMGYYMIELSTVYEDSQFCAVGTNTGLPTYELELEFLIKPATANIYKPVEYIYNYIFSTGRHMCAPLTNQLARYIRKENKPINITRDNIPPVSLISEYAVTNKTNGVRYYMVSHNRALYLTSHKDAIRLCEYAGPSVLFDGELVSNTYWIIDAIMFNDTVITNRYLSDRQAIVKKFVGQIKVALGSYTIKHKEYFTRGSLSMRIMDALEHVNTQCKVENDGLILTSTKAYGNIIYKLKYDTDTNTVDFYINTKYEAHVYETSPKVLVKYTPCSNVVSTFTDPTCVHNTICECRYDRARNSWVVVRIRLDKSAPNHVSVANNIWNQIHKPMSVSFFLSHLNQGTTAGVAGTIKSHPELRHYNNVVKRSLILKYARGTLLDLGSGVGGDITKYLQTNIKHMVLTEPNADKMPELHSRIRNLRLDTNIKIQVINTSVQDLILSDSYDTVCSFFMLSFFYDSERTLDKFVDTVASRLNTNGYFIGTMIDNHRKQYDGTYDGDIEIRRNHETNNCNKSSAFKYGVKVQIKFPGCLDQTEYESSFSELYTKLKQRGIQLIESEIFESRDYLSSDENRYVSLYRFFVFKKMPMGVEILDYPLASPSRAVLYASDASPDVMTDISADTIRPVFKELMIRYATNIGIDDHSVHMIQTYNLKRFDIQKIDTLNMCEITDAILSIYKDLVKRDPAFALQHACRVTNKNAVLYTGDTSTRKVTMCSAFENIDIDEICDERPPIYRVI